MKLKAQFTPEIYNFPNLHYERLEVEEYINELTQNIVELKELPEWEIRFLSLLGKGNHVGVSKKGYTYPSYPPEKQYIIYIPIPTNEEIGWGIKKNDYFHKPPLDEDKLMDKVEGIEFTAFSNLGSYIVECSKIGIGKLLRKGISLKGVKIRV